MKLFKIISKNLKMLVRSKSSALIIVLGPLLLMFLVGMAFNNSSTLTINIGYFSPDDGSNLTESYLSTLNHETYRLIEYESQDECINEIKGSKVHTCIIFPENFEIVDQTKQNLVFAVINTLKTSFVSRSSELSMDLTNTILDVVDNTQNTINTNNADKVPETIKKSDAIISTSKQLQNKLTGTSVDSSKVGDFSGSLDEEGKILDKKIKNQYTHSKNLLNLTESIFSKGEVWTEKNASIMEEIEDNMKDYGGLDGPIYQSFNDSKNAKEKFVNKTLEFTSSVDEFVGEVEDLIEIQNEVVAGLKNGLDEDIKDLKTDLIDIKGDLDEVLIEINSIKITDAGNIVNPIKTNVETVVPEKSKLEYLFPSLIVLLIMLISILLSSTLILMEKSSKAYFRNFTTPTSDYVFVLSTFLTSIFIMVIQISIVLIIAEFRFNTSILSNFKLISLLVLMIASVFVLVGMVIGYLFNTEQTAMIGAISLGALALLLSDFILPMESMPLAIQKLVAFNPFVVGSEALKKVLIFSAPIEQIKSEISYLGVFILVVSALILVVQKIMKTSFINKVTRGRIGVHERPESVRDIFRIDNHVINDERELYRFIKRLTRKEFKMLVYKRSNRVADFTGDILKQSELAKRLSKMKTKWGILKVIEKHLKKKSMQELHVKKVDTQESKVKIESESIKEKIEIVPEPSKEEEPLIKKEKVTSKK